MNILVVWTWYVWLTHWTCLADLWNYVVCIDIDQQKIENLKKWIMPIYEPWLWELVKKNFDEKRLVFSTKLEDHINDCELVFIAVWTPPWIDWHADLQYIKKVAEQIWQTINKYTIIVNKSTVPVWTWDMVEKIIRSELEQRNLNFKFDVVSNPEFLKEWTAIDDFKFWDRIVIWCNNWLKAFQKLEQLYSPLKETQILKTDLYTAEIIKYSANSLLAVEVSFVNALSMLCEKVWADINLVSKWLKLDTRIWKKAFLNAWPWFWGSCFPKDVMEFVETFKDFWIYNWILESTLTINEQQKLSIFKKIEKLLWKVDGKNIAILWVTFKANTDDIRYSPSLVVVDELIKKNANINIFDPQWMDNFKKFYPKLNYFKNIYDCIDWTDCIVILTDWDQFKEPNFEKISKIVKQKNIVDWRNIYEKSILKTYWFNYLWVWR